MGKPLPENGTSARMAGTFDRAGSTVKGDDEIRLGEVKAEDMTVVRDGEGCVGGKGSEGREGGAELTAPGATVKGPFTVRSAVGDRRGEPLIRVCDSRERPNGFGRRGGTPE